MSSINRNMKKYTLQFKTEIQNKSRQWIEEWIDVKEIDIAIYSSNYIVLTSNNLKIGQSTNNGLTLEKNIKETINRIVLRNKIDKNKYDEIYEITFANPKGKYTQLFLKRLVM